MKHAYSEERKRLKIWQRSNGFEKKNTRVRWACGLDVIRDDGWCEWMV